MNLLRSRSNVVNSIPRDTRYHCNECNEDISPNHASSTTRPGICITCGSQLREVLLDRVSDGGNVSEGVTNANGNISYLNSILDLIDVNLHNQILEALNRTAPSRQISVSYLQSLGKVSIDPEKLILRDISLTCGPLQMLAVSASFSSIAQDVYQITSRLVLSKPVYGQSKLINLDSCNGSLVVFQRGEVSFARKCMHAMEAGASAVVIIQSTGMWPFVMTDTADELAKNNITLDIPVVMISQSDGDLLRKLLEEGSKLNKKRPVNSVIVNGVQSIEATLRFGHSSGDCSICQDPFEIDQMVYKLPCRHVYHVDCVTAWLQQRNTCPLCRLELPKEKKLSSNSTSEQSNHDVYYN